jgi:hypothetical protein
VRTTAAGAFCLLPWALLWLPVAPLEAQSIRGRLLDEESGAPISGGTVALLDRANRPVATVESDSAGEFVLEARRPGLHRLQGKRLGYLEATSVPVELLADQVMEVELRLSVRPLQIPPLTVLAARRSPGEARLAGWGYYDRKSVYGKYGFARFLDHDEIQQRGPVHLSSVLNTVPGVRTVYLGGRNIMLRGHRRACSRLRWYLDGARMGHLDAEGSSILDAIPLSQVIAIEVYTGMVGSARFGSCAVVVWTGIP